MYKIVGADQKEYGPVTQGEIRQWITEGRANAQTIARLADGPWKPLVTFPEFSSLFSNVPPAIGPTPGLTLPPPADGSLPPTSGMAIAGFVCSILGLLCCGPIVSTLGLIFSLIALSQINQIPPRCTGKGLALAGIVIALLGYLFFAILLSTGFLSRALKGLPHNF